MRRPLQNAPFCPISASGLPVLNKMGQSSKYLGIFLRLKLSPSLTLNKIEHFSKVSLKKLDIFLPEMLIWINEPLFKCTDGGVENATEILWVRISRMGAVSFFRVPMPAAVLVKRRCQQRTPEKVPLLFQNAQYQRDSLNPGLSKGQAFPVLFPFFFQCSF